MESASEPRSGSGKRLTPDQLQAQQKKQTLLLSRASVLKSLQTCESGRYRAILEKALKDLDSELQDLG